MPFDCRKKNGRGPLGGGPVLCTAGVARYRSFSKIVSIEQKAQLLPSGDVSMKANIL